jgi:hypothetical protein
MSYKNIVMVLRLFYLVACFNFDFAFATDTSDGQCTDTLIAHKSWQQSRHQSEMVGLLSLSFDSLHDQ